MSLSVKNAFQVLRHRKLLYQVTNEDLLKQVKLPFDVGKAAAYVGFDPTSESIHLGNYVNFLALHHFRRSGIQPIVLFGGATGLIGDPSGKSTERVLSSPEIISANVEKFRA